MMRRKLSLTVFTLLLSLPFISAIRKQANNKALDGKTFEVVITQDEGKKQDIPLKDNLIFKEGTFNTSYFMQMEKYPATEYTTTADVQTGIITFKAKSQNKPKDNMAWTGKINGDHVEGTVKVFIKKTKAILNYTFTGNLKKKVN